MGRDGGLHVVMLPWSAFGHLMPFYQLSIALAKTGVKVSFVSTPKVIERLPKIPSNLSHLFSYLQLQLPVLEKGLLPEGAEATIDVPFEKHHHLTAAYDLLQLPFKGLVIDQSPDWIIVDGLPHWAVDVAQELNIPLCLFSVFSCATSAFFGSPDYLVGEGKNRVRSSPEALMSPPEWFGFPSSVAFRKLDAEMAFRFFYGPTFDATAQRLAKILGSCQAVAARTCPEFESEYLSSFQKLLKVPVIPVGLLPSEKSKDVSSLVLTAPWVEVFKWLDSQETKSVVFVSFGSECKLSKDQVFEIAYGLELSKLPFLWTLKKPDWAHDDVDALPSGFGDRTHGRGIVCSGWAPQKEILAHSSIGGSLFHSGWGSVIETLQFGHVMVVLPLIIDQPLNARLLVDKELAVEIERGEDGSFSRDDIAKSLKFAMVSEEGERLRAKAREVGAMVNDEKLHQDHYVGEFVQFLRKGIQKVVD